MLRSYLTFFALFALMWSMVGSAVAEAEALRHPIIKSGASIETQYNSSITDTEIVFRNAMNALLGEVDESFSAKIYKNSALMVRDFKEGRLDVLVIDSLSFLELEDIVPPDRRILIQIGPSLKQRFLILAAHKNKDITFSSLRGGRVSIGGGRKVAKRFLDVTLLQQGLPVSEDYFSEIDKSKTINTAIIDLYFGKVDVVVVPRFGYELALELNPELGPTIKILATSDSMVSEVVGVRHDFPQERLEKIWPYFMNIPAKRIELIFDMFHISGFYPANDESLREVRELNEQYQALIRRAR
jgi:ABC-type amino acid transport substrate-binding protein